MSRPIKYQVYDHKQKMMFDVVELSQLNNGGFVKGRKGDSGGEYFVTEGYLNKKFALSDGRQIHRFQLRQYTGLQDRNGIEIYEGDIVTEHHGGLMFEPDFYQIQVVEWKEFGFMPFLRVIGEARHDYANNLKEFIVIGSIYEHPHLLEQPKAIKTAE